MEFDDPIVGTTSLIREAIQSPNYEAGIAGWIIRKDGTAEFLDIIARGNITADRVSVPFVNQQGDTYTVDIGEANVDQPGILFEFDGTSFEWDNGSVLVEAFDFVGPPGASGEMTIRPPQPDQTSGGIPTQLGNPPTINIRSHANGGIAGQINIFGSNALGDGSADDRPSFIIDDNFKIMMESLRPFTATLGSDSTRQITSTVFTSNLDGDELSTTIPAAGSDTIIVSVWAQADITAGAGFLCFEVRANNAAGAQLQAPVDGTGINLVNLAGSRITYFFQTPVTDPDFSNTPLFVRAMGRTSSGGTFTIQRARLTAQVSP